jgi:uncharacterized surface protein with fasciclin (FAS1) repeats
MKTIIDTAADAGNFTALLGALKAGSLMHTLRAAGPYTLFAPTDEAFARLSPAALAALHKDVRRLKALLCQHIRHGSHLSKSIVAGEMNVIDGRPLVAVLHGDGFSVSGAKVVQADIMASNGVIHAIDTVILPQSSSLAAVA